MIQHRRRARFLLEALQARLVRRKQFREELDRHLATQVRISRPIYDTHAARTEKPQDLVPTDTGAGRETQ